MRMRVIDDSCLKPMRSPAKYVFRHVHHAILAFAPERKDDFLAQHQKFRLCYEDTHNWVLKVTEANKIRLSRKVVEVVWAATYAYLAIEFVQSKAE